MSTYIFTHDHFGVHVSQLSSHDTDLLGSNVVDLDKEALAVLAAGNLESFPSPFFLFASCLSFSHCTLKSKVKSVIFNIKRARITYLKDVK